MLFPSSSLFHPPCFPAAVEWPSSLIHYFPSEATLTAFNHIQRQSCPSNTPQNCAHSTSDMFPSPWSIGPNPLSPRMTLLQSALNTRRTTMSFVATSYRVSARDGPNVKSRLLEVWLTCAPPSDSRHSPATTRDKIQQLEETNHLYR